MAQARTLDEAQIKRVQRYLRTRRNHTRDSTIFTFAFNTGLRAKELAALCVGMHMTQKEQCVMHLFYSAAKPKVLAHALFISIAPYALH